MKAKLISFLKSAKVFITTHKIQVSAVAVLTALCITAVPVTMFYTRNEKRQREPVSSSSRQATSLQPTAEESSSQAEVPVSSSEPASSSNPVTEKPKVKEKKSPAPAAAATAPVSVGSFKYNTNSDIDDNIFLDSLIYTGYNITKHRNDGKMWQYVLAPHKRGLGWLSKITYAGGSTGYETTNGAPDIGFFEKHGLVCASYVTYVYFNYLPNVAGIDTSALARPERSTSANDWYGALKQWINAGHSKRISFTASKTSSGFINFKAAENIPIGSVLVFCDAKRRSDTGSHVAIYAGYKNNYNWVFHVGNSNGPEFCTVERMHFGPDPQWPIAVITPPASIRMSALLDIAVTDTEGHGVGGTVFTLTNKKTGAVTSLTSADNGKVQKENLAYGDYSVIISVPDGYTLESTVGDIKLTTANNSKNAINIILNKKIPEPEPAASSSAEEPISSSETES